MKQSRSMSMIEAITNVLVGCSLAIMMNTVVFPWFGIDTNLPSHLAIGLAFLGVSLARGYVPRRLFESCAYDQGAGRGTTSTVPIESADE